MVTTVVTLCALVAVGLQALQSDLALGHLMASVAFQTHNGHHPATKSGGLSGPTTGESGGAAALMPKEKIGVN